MIFVFAKTSEIAREYILRHRLNSSEDGSDRANVIHRPGSLRGVEHAEVRLVDDWRLNPLSHIVETELRIRAKVGHLTYSEVEF